MIAGNVFIESGGRITIHHASGALGTAVYRKKLTLASLPGRLWLDLGVVHEIAAVKLNGVDLGVVWTKPARVDISHAVRTGANDLEITVVNLWPNRMIGDDSLPPKKRLTETNLKDALAGESQAHIKYLTFADKAEEEGYDNVARLFRAASFSEQVHASKHLKVLSGIGSTAENLGAAVGGEGFEIEEMYPAYLEVKEFGEEIPKVIGGYTPTCLEKARPFTPRPFAPLCRSHRVEPPKRQSCSRTYFEA
jgi:hypothetical protein